MSDQNHRLFWVAALSAATFFACSPGQRGAPKFGSGPAAQAPSPTEGASTSESPPPSLQKLVYHIGPIDLPAGTTLEKSLAKPATLPFQVSDPIWIVGFKPSLIDGKGAPLSNDLVHKAIVVNKQEANPFCNGDNNGNPFAVATSTMTSVQLPSGYGYPLLPTDPLEARVVLKNQTNNDYYGIYFTFEFDALPMEKAQGLNDVKAMLLDIDPCDGNQVAIEPGKFAEKNRTFTVPQGGNLVVANGLLSDYGVSVSLTQEKQIMPFWKAMASLDNDHRILDLEPNPFVDPSGVQLKKEAKLTLGVAFDNVSDEWHQSATGGALVFLAPSSD